MKRSELIQRALASALLVQTGCSLLYADDADRKQCQRDEDCRSRDDDDELVCKKPEGVCTDANVDCEQNADCPESHLCGFDGTCYAKWGCLDDDPDWPDADDDFTFSSALASLTNPENPDLLGNDIEVLACSSADPECASPIANGEVDEDKQLTLRFADFSGSQFNGFIRIRDAAAAAPESAAFMPTYVHYGSESRLVSTLPVQTRILMVNPAAYPDLARLAGVQNADASAGTVVFIMHDCGGKLAAQVSMRAEGTSAEFLAVQGGSQPVPDATATTEDGAGLLFNVPPEQARTFVLTDDDTGDEIDRVAINVRGQATNYVFYYPRHAALSRWLDEHERLSDD